MTRIALPVLAAALASAVATAAGAQEDVDTLVFVTNGGGTDFTWAFRGPLADDGSFLPECGQLVGGGGDTYADLGGVFVTGNVDIDIVCSQTFELAYDERGFEMDPFDGRNPIRATRKVWVPPDRDFVRWVDRIESTDFANQFYEVMVRGSLGYPVGQVLITSSGDDVVGVDDDWVVSDDGDPDGGLPALAFVWSSPDAPQRPTSAGAGPDFVFVRFGFTLPAGGTVATAVFAVRSATRAGAITLAAETSELWDRAGEHLEDDLDVLFNVVPPSLDAPRARFAGPRAVPEGGTLDLVLEAEDPQGEDLTIDWDLDDDGAFDDLSDALVATVSAEGLDGPGTLPVAVRVADQTGHETERRVLLAIDNVPPAVTSGPPAAARTGERYSYAVIAEDVPGDTIGFEAADVPDGMVVSADGVVTWTPAADGRGPEVPVVVCVFDEDGGEAEHAWSITMAGAPVVEPGGPYAAPEGGTVELAPRVSDPEGEPVTLAWDLDGDGDFDDSQEATVTWSVVGDGPGDALVPLLVSDGEMEARAAIPVHLVNAPPVFRSAAPDRAFVGVEWSYRPDVVDPGEDPFTIRIEERPLGLALDPDGTLRLTPRAEDAEHGAIAFRIVAEDEDGASAEEQVVLRVREGQPPPLPRLVHPTDGAAVEGLSPTIVVDTVEDPDGDPVQYFFAIDADSCFCSNALVESGPVEPGALGVEWTPPEPLALRPGTDGDLFHLRRWAFDGHDDGDVGTTRFRIGHVADGGPDGGGAHAGSGGGCSCRTAGAGGSPAWVGALLLAFAVLVLARGGRRAGVILAVVASSGCDCAGEDHAGDLDPPDPTACSDPDGDGFGVGAACEGDDCDEGNPYRQSGCGEDCAARPDDVGCPCEGAATVACFDGPPEVVSRGICGPGARRCDDGRWTICAGQVLPRPDGEVCNGLDDDCDGDVDRGVTGECGTCAPCNTQCAGPGEECVVWEDPEHEGLVVTELEYLSLPDDRVTTPHVAWPSSDAEGRVFRVDTRPDELGHFTVLGAYWTAPENELGSHLSHAPSRSRVDDQGNVVFANRGVPSSIVKVLADPTTCPDRNENGVVDTSTGWDDLLAFDENGPRDECIAWYTPLDSEGARPVILYREDPLDETSRMLGWVGSGQDQGVALQFDHETGELTGEGFRTVGVGPYGGAVDREGWFWMTMGPNGEVGRFQVRDPDPGSTWELIPAPIREDLPSNELIIRGTIDENDTPWFAGAWDVYRYDRDAEAFVAVHVDVPPGDLASDGRGSIWAGTYYGEEFVYRIANDDSLAWEHVATPGTVSFGVGPDFDEHVWVLGAEPVGEGIRGTASVVDLVTGEVHPTLDDCAGQCLNFPYPRGDFTGMQGKVAPEDPSGRWSRVFEGCDEEETLWRRVRVDADVPAHATLAVTVRTAATAVALADAPEIALGTLPQDGPDFDLDLESPGRFLRVDVVLATNGAGTPVLRHFYVDYGCPSLPL